MAYGAAMVRAAKTGQLDRGAGVMRRRGISPAVAERLSPTHQILRDRSVTAVQRGLPPPIGGTACGPRPCKHMGLKAAIVILKGGSSETLSCHLGEGQSEFNRRAEIIIFSSGDESARFTARVNAQPGMILPAGSVAVEPPLRSGGDQARRDVLPVHHLRGEGRRSGKYISAEFAVPTVVSKRSRNKLSASARQIIYRQLKKRCFL